MSKAICTLSGGYDSALALLWALDEGHETQALFVDYGQPYWAQERLAVDYVVRQRQVQAHPKWHGWHVVEGPQLRRRSPEDPWIPYRNLVIAALVTNWAVAYDVDTVVFGSKSAEWRPDDPISYLDSTVGFYRGLAGLVEAITEPERRLFVPSYILPLVGKGKKEVLYSLHTRGFDLGRLWNCYREDGVEWPCGECLHCQETQPLVAEIGTGEVGDE